MTASTVASTRPKSAPRANPKLILTTPPSQRGGIIRRFFPTDSPPVPPGNVGQ